MLKKPIKAGLLGHPVSKSLSREIFAVFSGLLGEAIDYSPIDCAPADLPLLIPTLRPQGWAGFNVTLPHKQKVCAMLNLADPAAKACGSVNAVRFGRAGLEGTNTDAHALVDALAESGFGAAGRKAAVFGAGGAAASSGWALGRSRAGAVTFHARSAGAAAALAARLSEAFPNTAYAAAPFEEPGRGTEIFVNATPLGMYQPGRPPCEPQPGQLCVDLAYAPGGTEFSNEARRAGAAVIDGLTLLVGQAALSLRFWTGLPSGDIVKFKGEAFSLLEKRLKGGS